MPHEPISEPLPRLLPWLICCAILAVLIDLGRFHTHHHGDTLVPVLCSLYYWTPFYWEQDRLGSLLPLLALPARHPFVNLLVQSGLGIFFSLISFFLLPRYVLRDRTWPIVGGLGLISFLMFTPDFYRFTFMAGHQPYFTSLALGLAGLIATERAGPSRTALGLILLLLAHWVHLGAFTILLPLATARAVFMTPISSPADENSERSLWLRVRNSEAGRQFILLGVSTLVGIALTRLSRYHPNGGFGFMSPANWILSWSQMSLNAWAVFQQATGVSWPDFLLGVAAVGLLWTCCCGDQSSRSQLVRTTVVFGCAGAGNALVTGSTNWVRINQFDPRYWTATLIMFQAGLITIGVQPLLRTWNAKAMQRLGTALVPILLGVTTMMYGLPSIRAVRRDLDRSLGAETPEIIASQTTHVLGDYWDVWPAVYHANLTLYERGSGQRIWGISTRSHPTRKIWIGCPAEQMRIAHTLRPSHPDLVEENFRLGLRYLNDLKPLIEVERLATIRIFRPVIDSD